MALTINTNIINQADAYLLDAKNVKGSYIVLPTIAERDKILNLKTVIVGTQCYVQSDGKLYECAEVDGVKSWVESKLATQDWITTQGYATVSASAVGTSTEEARYITINGTEYKLTGSGEGPSTDTNQTVKGNGIAFSSNAAVDIVTGNSDLLTITGNNSANTITITPSTDLATKTYITEQHYLTASDIAGKQDKLTAGNGIKIENDTISTDFSVDDDGVLSL